MRRREDGGVVVLQWWREAAAMADALWRSFAEVVAVREVCRNGSCCCSSLLRCCSRGSGRRTVQLMGRSWWLREKMEARCSWWLMEMTARMEEDGGGARSSSCHGGREYGARWGCGGRRDWRRRLCGGWKGN
ncbi:hypothetical protein DEO72_LG1g2361 [Vigna unguiculata]|uniref:Uncharacterized protein n=1 Tax=Vigna unguiculata TaxID=3917 RepID=A0A4D6KQ62_VIGUN|nr:hypothetical protein DEO72_LG1g2361 [Vigna unguiculata]